jgi:Protein of unknown function (DUF3800)
MYVFLDESFRTHATTRAPFGVLAGICVPDHAINSVQSMLYAVRKPYHDKVLHEGDEIKGNELLGSATFRARASQGFSLQWNLASEMLSHCAHARLHVAGVICFDTAFHTFACDDENAVGPVFGCLLRRLSDLASRAYPNERVQIVFDGRDFKVNERNAKAITNFLVKSPVGRHLNLIMPYPLFGVSQAHNYPLQVADLVTTVIAMHHEERRDVRELYENVRRMAVRFREGESTWRTLKVLGKKKNGPGGLSPMAE